MRGARVEGHAQKLMVGWWWGRDSESMQESAKARKLGRCKHCKQWRGARVQKQVWTHEWKECGIQRARNAGMQSNAFMEDGAGKHGANHDLINTCC